MILSLNYQPRRIEEIFGDGGESGLGIRYVVEPAPLGTAGAVRYAGESLRESVVVFNGDVLTEIDLAAVIRLHRERKAKATIVLTPVDNPSRVRAGRNRRRGNIQRFLEKPNPDEITCNTINAGIYVLEPDTFDRIPKDTPWSIERSFFPSLIERGETFRRLRRSRVLDRHRHAGKVHAGAPRHHGRPLPASAARFAAGGRPRAWISPEARVDEGVTIEGPCFIDAGAVVKTGARIGPYSVVGRQCWIEEHATLDRAIVWPNTRISQEAVVRGSILGRHCHVGRSALIENGVVLGDKSVITDYSRL